MDATTFNQKMQDGSLTEADMKAFIESVQTQLMELKQKDPAKYLDTLTTLTKAVDAANEVLEQAT